MDLSSRLSPEPASSDERPRPGQEYFKGWGVFALPFDSGHVLALRVARDSAFGPYRSVWHRDPGGVWSIYVDGQEPTLGCPRYFGDACAFTGSARIDLTWSGPTTLRVEMDDPQLRWTVTASASAILHALNGMGSILPEASWRSPAVTKMREWIASRLGMGALRLQVDTPNGFDSLLMPSRMYYVDRSSATIDGSDVGHPVRLPANPMIGDVALPARGVLAQGKASFEMRRV